MNHKILSFKLLLLSICATIAPQVLLAESPIPIELLLDSYGKIDNAQNLTGTVDLAGYCPVIDECEGLVFVPAALSVGWNAMGSGLNLIGWVIAVSGSDVYVGGQFTNAGGNPNADYIARWDGSTWNALGTGLTSNVIGMTISGSDLYVGGYFTNAGGNANADYIARWDGTTWNSLGSGLNSQVLAVAITGGNVYAGGYFTDAGGNASADYIARWDGSSWNALGSGISNNVNDIVVSGSNVYVGGGFTNAGGIASADYVARWDGSSWNALGSGLNGVVQAVTVSGNNVYVGGDFLFAGGNNNANRVAFWNGTSWNALGTGVNSTVHSIATSGANVYIGGAFTNAGGIAAADYIARWEIALPVELVSFEAKPNATNIKLSWITATENGNKGYYIERKVGDTNWENIGFVAGQGFDQEPNDYSYLDERPLSGTNYYRLKQVDFDGEFEYSSITSAQLDFLDNTIQLFPNPTTGILQLKGSQVERIQVFHSPDKLMLQIEQPDNSIDISNLPTGMYFFKITKGGMVHPYRIVKE